MRFKQYLNEAMTKDQYNEMLANTQMVAQKATRDYEKFKKILMKFAKSKEWSKVPVKEISALVNKFQNITYGTIFDYPLRGGGFGKEIKQRIKEGWTDKIEKEFKEMQGRIDNFEKWRKNRPTQKPLFEKTMSGVAVYGKMHPDKNVEITLANDKAFVIGGKWKSWRDAVKDIKKMHPDAVQVISV